MKYPKILISEYDMPSDFVSIWEKEMKTNLFDPKTGRKTNVEKLFIHEKQLDKYKLLTQCKEKAIQQTLL